MPATGQHHQFERFDEIVAKVGRVPRKAIVTFYVNDVGDDLGHPAMTVVDGHIAQKIWLDAAGNRVFADDDWLQAKARAAVKHLEQTDAAEQKRSRLSSMLRSYSLTINTLYTLAFRRSAPPETLEAQVGGRMVKVQRLTAPTAGQLATNAVLPYSTLPQAAPSKAAIIKWRDDARRRNYDLVFVLIPPAEHHADTRVFSEVGRFMQDNGVKFIDLTTEFASRGLSDKALYWPADIHFSDAGNDTVGRILAERIGKL